MAGEGRPEPWPSGCPKPNSCARHRACVYNCWRRGSDIAAEIDSAVALRQAEGRTACENVASWPPRAAPMPGFEAGAAHERGRIVAWLREIARRHYGDDDPSDWGGRSALTIAADAIERDEHG